MAKVMLVEDDNNLREIYEARLAAEGYEIVAAQDGEEALALAVKERPDLIIADIMMPKVSGFDMLDILRSTPETKHTKIIMMTALSQAEDKTRAEKLGADRYLVKSQVTLEDVVKVASEMLNDSGGDSGIGSGSSTPSPEPPVPTTPTSPPSEPSPSATSSITAPAGAPTDVHSPASTTVVPPSPTTVEPPQPVVTADEPPVIVEPPDPTPPAPAPEPESTAAKEPEKPADSPQPQPEPEEPVIKEVPPEEKEEEKRSSSPAATPAEPTAAAEKPAEPTPPSPPEPALDASSTEKQAADLSDTTAHEEANVSKQIEDFISNNPTLSTSAGPEAPTPKVEVEAAATPSPISVSAPTPPAAEATPAKKTSIPVTVADEDSKPTEKATDQNEPSTAPEVVSKPEEKPAESSNSDDGPVPAQKRGGERVIQPLSDPKVDEANLARLLATEEDATGLQTPGANSVITPGGTVTTAPHTSDSGSGSQPAFSDGNGAPGTVVQAPTSTEETSNSSNIAL